MATANDLKTSMTLNIDGQLWNVVGPRTRQCLGRA